MTHPPPLSDLQKAAVLCPLPARNLRDCVRDVVQVRMPSALHPAECSARVPGIPSALKRAISQKAYAPIT